MSLRKAILGVTLTGLLFVPVSAFAIMTEGGAGIPNGVYCKINEVRLFAASVEDCKKAGGVVTHTVKTTVTPEKSEK